MGEDKRIPDLTELTDAQIIALLATLVLEMDDPSFSSGESKKVRLTQLLSSRAVPDNDALTHKAMTEAGFKNTEATESRKGVVTFATTAQINSLASAVVFSPAQLHTALNVHSTGGAVTLQSIYQAIDLGNPSFLFSKNGKHAILTGNVTPTFPGIPTSVTMYFGNLPLPYGGISQAVTGHFVKNGKKYALSGTINNYNNYLTQVILESNEAFPVGFPVSITCSYILG